MDQGMRWVRSGIKVTKNIIRTGFLELLTRCQNKMLKNDRLLKDKCCKKQNIHIKTFLPLI